MPLMNWAQEDLYEDDDAATEAEYQESFSSTRIINGHSVETLDKGVLQFRIEHRFGDIGGPGGGAQTMFGLDNAADIRFAFEYGLTDKMLIGIGRSKGAGNPYRSLIDGFYKYRFLSQGENAPLSLAAIGTATYTYMTASDDIYDVSNFPEWSHRLTYSTQLNASMRFGDYASIALMPTLVHRNYVKHDDVNTLFAMGAATRVKVYKKLYLNVEYYHVLNMQDSTRANAKNSLAFAFEWNTFGHNFKVDFANSRGFGDAQFITGTVSDWLKGQFRLGFSISRTFNLIND
jgi:hypothetical protein